MTQANAYYQACMKVEQTRAMEDVAQDLSDKKNEILEARRKRTQMLASLLTKTSTSKMNPKERKQAIKNMIHRLHGHYFSKLFNVLSTSESTPSISLGETKGEEKSETPQIPQRRPSSSGTSANLLRQSATVDFLSGTTVNSTTTPALGDSVVEGETKESTTTLGRKVPETPIDDSINESSVTNDPLNGTWDEDVDNSEMDISRAADAYEQRGEEQQQVAAEREDGSVTDSVNDVITSMNDSIISLGRGGASPGARRERFSGLENDLEEYEDDLEGSWDGE